VQIIDMNVKNLNALFLQSADQRFALGLLISIISVLPLTLASHHETVGFMCPTGIDQSVLQPTGMREGKRSVVFSC
jgi:hypothetical protein